MSSLLSDIHFWTLQEDVITTNSYYGSFKYHPKKEHTEVSSKKIYCNRREILWSPVNKRQNRLKDRLKELEDSLVQNKIICYLWKDNTLQLLLSTGLIVFITIKESTGDILNITFDKQLSAKLQVNIICDGLILGQQVICICNDGHVLGYGGSWREGWLLEGGPRRRIHSHSNWLVVWGRPGSEHPQPWSPLTKDHQRANLHLYWLGLRSPELLAYKNTDGEPFIIRVSKVFEHVLISVEQKVTQRGTVSVEVSTIELSNNTLKTVAITAVPLQTHVSCCELSPNEEFLLICCIDSTIAILDRNSGSTKTVKASFIPKICTWQMNGALMAICNENGQLQYYDVALNNVKSQILGEDEAPSHIIDLTGYFQSQVSVVSLNWENSNLIIALEQGPIVCVTHMTKSLTFVSLAVRYVNIKEIKKAIALLLNWKFGDESFFVLQKIASYLLKKPLSEEIALQLQDALGSFHAATIPLDEDIRNQFKKQVFSLTRRFFHHLVRARMYETAFLLAVDMMQHDLFMDLHYIALKIGETEMAAAARAQASTLVSRCSSEASNCSRSSCSECSSPCTNTKDKSFNSELPNTCTSRASDILSDNLLSTNFNQPESKNFTSPSSIHEPPKIITSLGNYVKPPIVPLNFKKPILPYVPPLPSGSTVPKVMNNTSNMTNMELQMGQNNLWKNSHFLWNEKLNFPNNGFRVPTGSNSLGTPLLDLKENSKSSLKETTSHLNEPNPDNSRFREIVQPPLYRKPSFKTNDTDSFVNPPQLSHLINGTRTNTQTINPEKNLTSRHITTNPQMIEFNKCSVVERKSSFVPTKPIITPPLPIMNTSHKFPPQSSMYDEAMQSKGYPLYSPAVPSTASRKPHPKVKFSNTVTAFIVPEVKRHVRPAPPSHITDPQKELADSLPLCHPNEDYLKDFAPVKSNEESEKNGKPPKIKVVHFGVV
ncbi:WD repeat-containing and planar cell polarity effector protein fritz [Coccinella septempunctata]|uniref:WD repeat-containing and planar cell polarity effector protein fritz n=1 Tax=Coccinella septempunctata TaxID=41139 RepID=UPI001D083604|nr:WD repeat-containing and planar cell polarity effector protein fritz [Coccinella septempunctata]